MAERFVIGDEFRFASNNPAIVQVDERTGIEFKNYIGKSNGTYGLIESEY